MRENYVVKNQQNSTTTATTNNGPPSASVAQPENVANTNGDNLSGSENVRISQASDKYEN